MLLITTDSDSLTPLSLSINMHLLHTVLHTCHIWYCLGESVQTSIHFRIIFGDHFIPSYDLYV